MKQNSSHINQIKNENSDWSKALPSNGIPVLKKVDMGAQFNVIPLTILKNFDSEPDLCPVNIKLSTCNNSKVLLLGKCWLSLKDRKDHFDVSFIVVDSKSVLILGLSTSESLNLIKRISTVKVSDEQLLSEFSNCFEKIETLKNTCHIEIKDSVTPVLTRIRKNVSPIIFIIFRGFLMFYQIFLSPQGKRSAIISNKHVIYELPHKLPNDLRLRILGN